LAKEHEMPITVEEGYIEMYLTYIQMACARFLVTK
jgi:hypothetical protein